MGFTMKVKFIKGRQMEKENFLTVIKITFTKVSGTKINQMEVATRNGIWVGYHIRGNLKTESKRDSANTRMKSFNMKGSSKTTSSITREKRPLKMEISTMETGKMVK